MRISDWSSDVCASDLVYEAIDWQVIVLLAAMMPVGEALETTGAAKVIAEWLSAVAGMLLVWGIMGLLLVLTMLLSVNMNNAATAVALAQHGSAQARAIARKCIGSGQLVSLRSVIGGRRTLRNETH